MNQSEFNLLHRVEIFQFQLFLALLHLNLTVIDIIQVLRK